MSTLTKVNSTEKKILLAAMDEFIECGLKGARMQSIADRAGVNKALLHYYYRSKEKLYLESLREVASTFFTAMELQFQNQANIADPRSLIQVLVTTYINTMAVNPAFPRMIIREISDGGNNIPMLAQGVVSRFGEIPRKLFTVLKKGMEKGVVRKMNMVHLMMNLMGMCAAAFVIKPAITGLSDRLGFKALYDDLFYRERIESIVAITCDGLLIKEKK